MPRKTNEQKEIEYKEEIKKVVPKSKEEKPKTEKKSASNKGSTSTNKKTASKTIAKKDNTKATKKSTLASTKNKVAKKTIKSNTKKQVAKNTKVVKQKNTFEVVEYYDLPYRYNQTVVKVLAQTPTNLFIYWDISDDDIKNYKKEYGDNFLEVTKPVLIVHNQTLNNAFEVDINDFSNSWYLKVNNSKCIYRVELGRRPINYSEKIDTDYIYITKSNEMESPNDRILKDNSYKTVKFKNIKTNNEYTKSISDLKIAKNISEIYNIYDIYKLIYEDENTYEVYSISNPSSANPSSGTFCQHSNKNI